MNKTNEMIEINNTKDKELTFEKLLIKEIINNIKDPYKLLSANDISKDLHIGINTAYELFKKDTFPYIEIGKNKKITLLAYTLWKLKKV